MGKQKTVSAVRLDDDQLTRISAMASERRIGVSTLIRQLVDLALGMRPGDPSPFAVPAAEPPADTVTGVPLAAAEPPADTVTGVPLAAAGVGAGAGQLELIPEGVHPYFFRRSFLERKGWADSDPDRFAIYKLGTDEVANSMDPTIAPESVVLVDREADRDAVEERSIWVVRVEGELILKRVTVDDGWIVLESDNRHPVFRPRVLHVTRKERHRILIGRVVWHAAELA